MYVPNSYEFVYVPVDLYTNSNLGFGYVSLIDSYSLMILYDAVWVIWIANEQMNNKRWPNTTSKKVCEITFARIQVELVSLIQNRETMTCENYARTGQL